jgi:hypothetical protein
MFIPHSLKLNKNIKYENIENNINYVISSLTKKDTNIIYATYNKLFILNLKDNIINELIPPKEVSMWVPTGVKYHKKNNLIYVANYLGKNILIFKLKDNLVLELIEEITENMVGPENIDITNNGNYLAVADYDGCQCLLFKYICGKHIKVWNYKIGYAHGISFSPDENSIIVSGLSPPIIYKIDINGNIINDIGTIGWKKDNYQWPTSICRYNKNLLISDAHHGKITIINSDLDTIKCFGGNGVSLNLFNMPYSIEYDSNEDKFYIADTFKKRILILNSEYEIINIYDNFNKEINNVGLYKCWWKPSTNDNIDSTINYEIIKNIKVNEEVYVEVCFSLYKENINICNGISIPKIIGFNDIIEFNIKDEIQNWVPNKLYKFHKIYKTKIQNNSIILELLHSNYYYKYDNDGITVNIISCDYKSEYYNNIPIINSKPMYEGYIGKINKNEEYSIVFDNFTFGNKKYNPSYHSLISNDNSKEITLDGTIHLASAIYYWINVLNFTVDNDNIIILGSPQIPNYLLIYKGIIFIIKLHHNYWIYNNKIITTNGKELIISKKIFEIKNKYISILTDIENKKDPIDTLCKLYLFSMEKFKTLFKSKLGKILIDELEEIYSSDDMIDIKYCRYYAIAKIYLDNVKDDNIYYITEISVANFLMKCNINLNTDIIYEFLKKNFQIEKNMDKNKLLLKLRNIVYQTNHSLFNKNNIRKNIDFLYENGIPFDQCVGVIVQADILVLFFFNYIQKTYCQFSQIIYIFLLSLFNIKSRPVALCYIDNKNKLCSHASVECYYNGKYIISDPHFAITIKNNNEYLSFKELHNLYINKNCNNIVKEISCERLYNGIFPNDFSLTTYIGLMNNIILKDESYILDNNDKIKHWIKYFQNLYKSDFYLSLIKL